jgi:superfamily II DNA or RNA helicase
VQELAPQARLAIAHGQMPERELEQVMLDFYRQRFNVLVCTTIIESGIDVPTANTIVINRADRFGLAQLHQLRGRVGRSHHRAYAYLIVPERAQHDGRRAQAAGGHRVAGGTRGRLHAGHPRPGNPRRRRAARRRAERADQPGRLQPVQRHAGARRGRAAKWARNRTSTRRSTAAWRSSCTCRR